MKKKDKVLFIKNKKDLYINFKNNTDNIILITGISGSGKSTLALDLIKKNKYTKVSLDLAVYHGLNGKITEEEKKLISKFKEKYPEWEKNLFQSRNLDKEELFFKWSNLFYDFTVEYFKNINTTLIIEGTHIYKYIDLSKIKDRKIIIKRTSFINSCFRSIKRMRKELKRELKNKEHKISMYIKCFVLLFVKIIINQMKWYNQINIFIEKVL